jgi:hypothetical protein
MENHCDICEISFNESYMDHKHSMSHILKERNSLLHSGCSHPMSEAAKFLKREEKHEEAKRENSNHTYCRYCDEFVLKDKYVIHTKKESHREYVETYFAIMHEALKLDGRYWN